MTPARLASLLSLTVPSAIAHRGGGKLRPENTLAAFEHAAALGVDAIECDVRLSRDGEVVVIHDESVDRTTNASGPVASFDAADLARIDAAWAFDAAGGFPLRGRGVGVPALRDVLARWLDLPFIVEIKGDRPRDAQVVVDVLREAGALDRVIVGGFSQPVLDVVRRDAPGVVTSASRVEVQSALRRSWFGLAPARPAFGAFQVPARFGGRRVASRGFVRASRRAGVPVQVWVVDDPVEMRTLLEWGVTGLISDRPDVAVQVAREAAASGRIGRT